MEKKLTDQELEKIEDFKNLAQKFYNHNNNQVRTNTINALFENIKKYYLEYKDEVADIPIQTESYKYHLLQPQNGKYELLDFLINRAISNIENIDIGEENAYDHAKILQINPNRYNEYIDKIEPEIIQKMKKKSLFHETNHALQALDIINDDDIHNGRIQSISLAEKIAYANQTLRKKYPNLLKPTSIKNKKTKQLSDYFATPFSLGAFYSEGTAEMYATLFSGLYEKNMSYYPTKIYENVYIITPNYLNGYAPFCRFFYYLRNLVSKESMFSSVFLGSQKALIEFSLENSAEINKVFNKSTSIKQHLETINKNREKNQIEKIQTDTPAQKMNALFHLASYGFMYSTPSKETLEAQESLDKIFLEAYKKKIATSNYNIDEMLNQLQVAYLSSMITLSNDKSKWYSSEVKEEYKKLIKQLIYRK